ncbi:signal peptidase I [Saccharopolyspora antimicrobica]|uniref:Signal peptidase I n=1 Tax=Saccharopolyspora antimicrobica TaxID=455193 RepID=A0A1I5ICY1_9PSEU|nr:signal peptidase I [Saccharopolyspora antimicrobica]RKT85543.1 signal peptidase I [Saccharopolyspora antimicrobica]SFO58120.1 signal peptidase I [Saccharopolyspora antimicrobica]
MVAVDDRRRSTRSGPTRWVSWTLAATVMAVGLLACVGASTVLWTNYAIYPVSAPDMSNTVQPGEDVIVAVTGGRDVQRGDVVVFDGSSWSFDESFIKRVVAVGGDAVSCCDQQGRIQVNGTPISEDYVRHDDPSGEQAGQLPFEEVVPQGMVFVLGDWRANSADSRVHRDQQGRGSIPVSAIAGPVVGIHEPWTTPRDVPTTSAFTDVGLATPAPADQRYAYLFWAAPVGALLCGIGFVWLLVLAVTALVRRSRRRESPFPR